MYQGIKKRIGKYPGLKQWIKSLGPGIITAAIIFGPSKMTITSKLGANYGYAMIWLVVVAIYFLILFTSMAGRIGLATSQSLLQTIRHKWGKPVSIIVGIGIFFVATSFQSGNSIGVGIALSEPTNINVKFWIVLFNILGLGLLFFKDLYKILEKLMFVLVALMLIAFLLTLIKINPDLSTVTDGLKPSIPAGSAGLIIAFIASCFSLIAAFYQCYLMQERRKHSQGATVKPNESVTGIVILGLLVIIVMICAGSVLHSRNLPVNSALDMAKALEPLFGELSTVLFLAGLFGASFSSLVGNAAIGGTLLGDSLGYGYQLNNKVIKGLIALVMIIGASIAIIFGKLPLNLIVLAQSVTIFIVPIVGIALFTIANDEKVMGSLKNNLIQKIMGTVGLALIIFLAIFNARDLFF
ncbi:MAG: manganese transporter [Sphingobacteriales bacterium UTBCD1]|jgi:Mn2+/Fe2+ NRAMP family transporter|nr:MAG: manganese transporter [Sphingobacteriales bacterium UTBCD1]